MDRPALIARLVEPSDSALGWLLEEAAVDAVAPRELARLAMDSYEHATAGRVLGPGERRDEWVTGAIRAWIDGTVSDERFEARMRACEAQRPYPGYGSAARPITIDDLIADRDWGRVCDMAVEIAVGRLQTQAKESVFRLVPTGVDASLAAWEPTAPAEAMTAADRAYHEALRRPAHPSPDWWTEIGRAAARAERLWQRLHAAELLAAADKDRT